MNPKPTTTSSEASVVAQKELCAELSIEPHGALEADDAVFHGIGQWGAKVLTVIGHGSPRTPNCAMQNYRLPCRIHMAYSFCHTWEPKGRSPAAMGTKRLSARSSANRLPADPPGATLLNIDFPPSFPISRAAAHTPEREPPG